MIINTNYI